MGFEKFDFEIFNWASFCSSLRTLKLVENFHFLKSDLFLRICGFFYFDDGFFKICHNSVTTGQIENYNWKKNCFSMFYN